MKSVYIIEDDHSLRQLLERFFTGKSDLTVHIAPEPPLCPLYPKGDDSAPADSPPCDFLIVDNQLPVMTGLEFIRTHGRSVRHKAVMSASFSPADLIQARKLGCKVFRKPFRLTEMANWINDVDPLEYHLTG